MKRLLSKLVVDLLMFQVLFWIVVIVFDTINIANSSVWIILLLVVNTVLYAVAAYIVKTGYTTLEYVVGGFLILNIILTITDQVGVMDYVILGVNIVTVGLLGWLLVEENKTE